MRHDLAQLAVLERELFGVDAWDEAALAAELEGPGRTLLVAAGEGGRLDGYAVLRVVDDLGDLLRLGVRRERQRRGLATGLLDEILAAARCRDVSRVLLEVSADNAAALAFYAAHGFVAIDRRVRYYRDGSDAVVLQLPLGP
jgi:ribosomal-protein-alanine N-acetyltransferase